MGRKAAEKASRGDIDEAFLMEVRDKNGVQRHTKDLSGSTLGYDDMRVQAHANRSSRYGMVRSESQDPLVSHSQASVTKKGYHSVSQDVTADITPQQSYSDLSREPQLPNL